MKMSTTGVLTALDKLNKLYEIKSELHPLTLVLVVGFVETQNRQLKAHDIKFINDVYPEYFKKNGKRVGGSK